MKKKKRQWLAGLLALAVFLGGCGSNVYTESAKTLTAEEAKTELRTSREWVEMGSAPSSL